MIKRIIATFLSAAVVLSAGADISAADISVKGTVNNNNEKSAANAEMIGTFAAVTEKEIDKTAIKSQKNKIELNPTCFDLGGGSAAISFGFPGKKYSCKINYKIDNVTYAVKPQANGFAYIKGLEEGKKYPAKITCTYNGKKITEEFTIKLSDNEKQLVSMIRPTENSLTLTWMNFAPSQTYIVYRQQNGEWRKAAETKQTYFTDSRLKSGTPYNYLIAVKGTDKKIAVEETKCCYYTVYNQSDKVTADFANGYLTWNPAKNADGYNVYWKTSEGFKIINETKQETSLKIEKDKRYYYAVAPFFVNSDKSVTVGKMTEAVRVPQNGLLLKKLYYDTTVMSMDSWASEKVCDIKKGSTVYVGELTGNFYHCIIGNRSGYIYKRAITGAAAPVNMKVTGQNLNYYLDDILFRTGTSPAAIWNYVNSMKYSVARSDARITGLNSVASCRNSLSVNMIKYQSGICYHYASLSAKLLSRAGYKVKIVYCPHVGEGFHCYNLIWLDEQWKYYDACRHAKNNILGYLPERDTFIKVRRLDAANEQISGIVT